MKKFFKECDEDQDGTVSYLNPLPLLEDTNSSSIIGEQEGDVELPAQAGSRGL